MSLAGAVRRLRLVSLAARSRCRLAASVSCRAASPSSLRRRAARAKRYQVGVAGDGAGLAELADGRQRRPGDAAQGAGGGLVTVDLDATTVIAHSENENAVPTWKKTLGFHPMTAWADHGKAGNGARWPSSCARGTRDPTPPPTTSRRPGWRWRSCRAVCGAGRSSAPTPAAGRTSSSSAKEAPHKGQRD